MAKYNMYVEDLSIESLLNVIGGVERAKKLVNHELIITEPPRPWREENGVIHFSVTSDGTTGEDWIPRLEDNGFRVGYCAKLVLCLSNFKPTSGMKFEVAVLKGMLFEDNDRITKKIRAYAGEHKLSKPNVEIACLIREKFTDEELDAMGLWQIVAMHEPIYGCDGNTNLLGAFRGDGGRWLSTFYGHSGLRWGREGGFAFVSQVSA